MKKKLALWVSQRRVLPYRLRKSFIKRTCPSILYNHPFEINFYGLKYSGNTKSSADRLFFMFGGLQKYMLSFLRFYAKSLGRKDLVFVDVGAHVGNHSLFMSKYVKHVHAFEPNPIVRDKLDTNIYMNNIENITVHPIGLGAANEVMPFYYNDGDHISSGSFKFDHDKDNSLTIDLKVRQGDEIFSEKKIERVDVIKIDVEGFERQVIDGLKQTIEKHRPLIIVEISETTKKSFGGADDFESIFPREYCFYKFSGVNREREHYKIKNFEYSSDVLAVDIIAVPREKLVYLDKKIDE